MIKNEKVQVKVFSPNGEFRGTIPVTVPLELDTITGEWCYTAEAIKIIDLTKLKYANIILPSQIRNIRERFGMTQEEMCDMLGLGARTWTRWETGAVIPTLAMNRRLLELWSGDYTISDLVRRRTAGMRWAEKFPRLNQIEGGMVYPFVVKGTSNSKEYGNETDYFAVAC